MPETWIVSLVLSTLRQDQSLTNVRGPAGRAIRMAPSRRSRRHRQGQNRRGRLRCSSRACLRLAAEREAKLGIVEREHVEPVNLGNESPGSFARAESREESA